MLLKNGFILLKLQKHRDSFCFYLTDTPYANLFDSFRISNSFEKLAVLYKNPCHYAQDEVNVNLKRNVISYFDMLLTFKVLRLGLVQTNKKYTAQKSLALCR